MEILTRRVGVGQRRRNLILCTFAQRKLRVSCNKMTRGKVHVEQASNTTWPLRKGFELVDNKMMLMPQKVVITFSE